MLRAPPTTRNFHSFLNDTLKGRTSYPQRRRAARDGSEADVWGVVNDDII